MTKIEIESLISPPNRVTIDPYALNALADDYRAVNAATYALAVSKAGPPPRAFFGGASDLPPFTASGIDASLLVRLPFACRHYAAAVKEQDQVLSLFEECGPDPFARLDHPGLTDAIGRVRDWASGRMDRDRLKAS